MKPKPWTALRLAESSRAARLPTSRRQCTRMAIRLAGAGDSSDRPALRNSSPSEWGDCHEKVVDGGAGK